MSNFLKHFNVFSLHAEFKDNKFRHLLKKENQNTERRKNYICLEQKRNKVNVSICTEFSLEGRIT